MIEDDAATALGTLSHTRQHAAVIPAMVPRIFPKKFRIMPSPQSRLMHLSCGNHAARCPKVPVKVWTVVPVSGPGAASKITIARHSGKAPPPCLRA